MTDTTRNQTSCRLSIVIPVYDEEPMLPALFGELEKVCAEPLKPYGPVEIVFVNDGSTDKSWDLIAAYCRLHPGCIGVNLSRNFGHQLALSAGLETARGDVVAPRSAVLHATARVAGKLRAPQIVIEDGAKFSGTIEMEVELPAGIKAGGV